MKLLWRNFPIPEPYIAALLVGGGLQFTFPTTVLPAAIIWAPTGLVLIFAGMALCLWATLAAGNSDLKRPAALMTGGPYAFSRNPMYLGWSLIMVGLSLWFNSLWLAIAALVAWLYLSFITFAGEERALQRNFGAEYAAYQKRVRRWL